jgi:sulfite reductase beta subunit-like hemoprotein
VRVPGGRLDACQLRALARAAALGNGLVELTSRANVQLRGLPGDAGARLHAILGEAGLLPSAAHDRVRNVLASPLAGRHPHARATVDDLLAALDRELCADRELAQLPGRFLFAVDDGSGLALAPLADVALLARSERSFALALSGFETTAVLDPGEAVAAALAAARAFLRERRDRGEGAWRIAELPDGPASVARSLACAISGPLPAPAGRLACGALAQRDGRLAVTALAPLGRLDAAELLKLAELAPEVRVGVGRTLSVLDVPPERAAPLADALAALGLELRPDSGWAGLSACAGLGRCPRARLDVHAAAALRARRRRSGAPPEHWAACERRCGERAGQEVAVAPLATGRGQIAVRIARRERVAAGLEQALALLEAD